MAWVLLTTLACTKPADRAIARGNEAARAGHLTEARAAYAEAAAADPGSAKAQLLLGNVAFDTQDHTLAAQAWAHALELDSTTTEARIGLAKVALLASDAGVAWELLSNAQLDTVEGHLVRARAALARGQPSGIDDALADANWVLGHEPANPEAQYLKGSGELAAHRLGDAQATFDALARGSPASALGPYGLARVAAAQSRETDAVLHLKTARTVAGAAWRPGAVASDPAFAFLSHSAEFKELVAPTP